MALYRWKNTIYCPHCGSSWHFTEGYSDGDKCPAACSLWSEAWDIAAKNKFQVVGDGRTFTCSWTNSFCKAGCETHNITFFCDENSYDKDEIAQINELEVGEIWSSKHYGTAHIVHRVS